MRWGYKSVHFALKKEGLLGGPFLDEAEIEEQLNRFGQSGWELVSVIEVQNGIICFFRQPLGQVPATYGELPGDEQDQTHPDEEEMIKPDTWEEPLEPAAYQRDDQFQEEDTHQEPEIEEYEVYQDENHDADGRWEHEPHEDQIVAEDRDFPEEDEDSAEKRIGAIRIE